MPFELFTDRVNYYRPCVSWPPARILPRPSDIIKQPFRCSPGVLPTHLRELPTLQAEPLVGTLVPEAQTRIMVSAPGRRGGGFGWLAAASQREKKTEGQAW